MTVSVIATISKGNDFWSDVEKELQKKKKKKKKKLLTESLNQCPQCAARQRQRFEKQVILMYWHLYIEIERDIALELQKNNFNIMMLKTIYQNAHKSKIKANG